jgi:hypothetical protein
MPQQTTIIDLRGSDSSRTGVGFGVLADPTGRRGRNLRRVGRAVAVLFAVWLAALALAGLGLLPGLGIPLASRAGIETGPPPLEHANPLVAAKTTRPALPSPAAAAAPTAAARPPFASARPVASPRRTTATAPAQRVARAGQRPAVAPMVATPAPRRPATAPGRSVASPNRSATAPGRIRRAATPRARPAPHAQRAPTAAAPVAPHRGNSASAPGRLAH